MDWNILLFVLAGFFAQMIDGCLGMAYGVSSTTILLSVGVPPAAASASVHIAEVFTTFVSGVSHWKMKNINKKLLSKLIIPGIIGGVLGAYLLTNLPTDIIKPIVSIYLLIMGVRILLKAFGKKIKESFGDLRIWILGLVGGFFDAIGGGGWGPIVTSTLIAGGKTPRYVIGSVNTAEFFVTLSEAAAFVTLIGITDFWKIILGLAIGGVIAAPFAAILTKKISAKNMMIIVAIIIMLLNIRSLVMMVV